MNDDDDRDIQEKFDEEEDDELDEDLGDIEKLKKKGFQIEGEDEAVEVHEETEHELHPVDGEAHAEEEDEEELDMDSYEDEDSL